MIAVWADKRACALVLSSRMPPKRIGADPANKDHRSYSGPSGRSSRTIACVLGRSAGILMNESPQRVSLLIRSTSTLNVMDIISMRLSQKLAVGSRLIKIV